MEREGDIRGKGEYRVVVGKEGGLLLEREGDIRGKGEIQGCGRERGWSPLGEGGRHKG